MPTLPLQSPDHPIALRRSHLLAPAPDRLTATPTTLRIVRENTVSGRDFSVWQLRTHEEVTSPRRSVLLFTVSGRFWSNSGLREIRDTSGRPLLELRRIWWKGQWSVRRPGGRDDLLHAEMRWGIGVKMGVRFDNALLTGQWDGDELDHLNATLNRNRHRLRRVRRRAADQESIRTLPRYELPEHHHGLPPPYSVVMAEDLAQQSSSGGSGGSGAESEDSSSDDEKPERPDCPLPSYDSVRRMRRSSSQSSHSLRDLLDAIEPPGEPAPASSSSLSSSRPRSEGGLNPKVELKLDQQSSSMAAVMMGDKRIIYVKRERTSEFTAPTMPKWEVGIAEGVDLLLATSIVLIMADSVKNESRMRTV